MGDFRRLLLEGPRYSDRLALERAFAHSCCWPHEPALEERALSLGFRAPPLPGPGEVWLISVAQPLGSRTSLWRLHSEPGGQGPAGPQAGVVPVVGMAAEALDLAERIPSKVLPIFSSLEPSKKKRRWLASFVAQSGVDWDETLDGRSFGLSMALSVVSLLIDKAIPGDLLASATLEPDGRVGPVDGLDEKVAGLGSLGLGIRRLLVAREQAEEARALVRKHRVALEVHGIDHVSEAVRIALGDLEAWFREGLSQGEALEAEVRRLFRLTLGNHGGVIDWSGPERAADILLSVLPPDHPLRFQAWFARQVARRHQGKEGALQEASDEELSSMTVPARTEYLAHVVQAAGDMADRDRAALFARVASRLPHPRDCFPQQLKVHGALGRGLATLRRYEEARDLLEEVVRAWEDAALPGEASWALCEWIRVLGILGDGKGVDRALAAAERLESDDGLSNAFLRFACGRTLVQLGRCEEARRHLADDAARWQEVPEHLALSRLRWLARTGADRERLGALEEKRAIGTLLWRLDVALDQGAEVARLVDEIVSEEPELCGAFLDPSLPIEEQAHRLAREYPY